MSENEVNWITCPGCYGAGRWESECCDGSGGCSCRGQVVQMGTCNVCGGRGEVVEGEYDRRANCNAIAGLHFLGSGSVGTERLFPNRGHFV